jgi:serine/threonine protein kinase
MLTGEPPFKGPDFLAQKREMIYRPVREIVPDLPEKIEEIIRKCLQPDREKRYGSVEELKDALR